MLVNYSKKKMFVKQSYPSLGHTLLAPQAFSMGSIHYEKYAWNLN